MVTHRKSGYRNVYNTSYKKNEYRSVFLDKKIENNEQFLISSFKLCINPKDYPLTLFYPEQSMIKEYEKKHGVEIDSHEVARFVDYFNELDPHVILNKSVTVRERKHLAASRYLKRRPRMTRLKEDYKAHRIHIMRDDFFGHLSEKNITYPKHNFNFFIIYVKNKYLKNRTGV